MMRNWITLLIIIAVAGDNLGMFCELTENGLIPLPDFKLSEEEEHDKYPPGSLMFWMSILISGLLTICAGLMSGLTVGFLSIDGLELELRMGTGTQNEKDIAGKVLRVLNHHHWLLVTLLITNAGCMEALPIFLDSIVPSYIAIIISVTCVLFFGEIIPQAICTGP